MSVQSPACPLGFSPDELARSRYAEFFRPQLAPLPDSALQALACGPLAEALLPPLSEARQLQAPGEQTVENGYTLCADGSARLAVRTPMPGVSPAMWDWWFAWHGSDPLRYRLWHPQAHVHVGWADGRDDLPHYIGRVSQVVEYVGAQCFSVRIRFVPPASLGFDEARLQATGEGMICGRIAMRLGGVPVETGVLVHHLRPVAGGREMRSRFWIGGRNVRVLGLPDVLASRLGALAGRMKPVRDSEARALLVHDVQEMGHLAAILPALHARFAGGNADASR